VLRELASNGKTDRIRLDAARELRKLEAERAARPPTDPVERAEWLAQEYADAMAALQ
jgi:hypothetical protein